MLLADLGAEVIKIERPGTGDENRRMRRYPGRSPDDEDFFYPMNRNKKSVEVDLKEPEARERLRPLLQRADVVVENFAAGAIRKLDLDYESIRAINPEVVYCSISGFGQTGPMASRKAYDSVIQALSGLMSTTGEADGPPLRCGFNMGDLSGALYAFGAIMTALYARERTGRGSHIDLALADALLSLFSTNAAEYLAIGTPPHRSGSESHSRSPTGSYLCADGRYLQIMGGSDTLWPRFCAALGLPALTEDPHFLTNDLRVQNRAALREQLAPVFARRACADWVEALNAIGLPCAPVNTLPDALADPQYVHRQMELGLDHPASGRIRTINNPFRFSTWRSWRTDAPPRLGEHNDILRGDAP
jgi:crotonobetainyl-CoA:carnitine CoA-transferase CaiB-like acyl-CoA transferase